MTLKNLSGIYFDNVIWLSDNDFGLHKCRSRENFSQFVRRIFSRLNVKSEEENEDNNDKRHFVFALYRYFG